MHARTQWKLAAEFFKWICLLTVISVQFEAFMKICTTYILHQLHRTASCEATKLVNCSSGKKMNRFYIPTIVRCWLHIFCGAPSVNHGVLLRINENNVFERAGYSTLLCADSNVYSFSRIWVAWRIAHTQKNVLVDCQWADWSVEETGDDSMAGSLCGRIWLCKWRWFWAYKRTEHCIPVGNHRNHST